MPDSHPSGWDELDALLEVANDVVGWLDELAVNLDTDYADVAGWRARLATAADDAGAALSSVTQPARSVPCDECNADVRVDLGHYDDGETYCEACCPVCSTNDAAADVPAPLDLRP